MGVASVHKMSYLLKKLVVNKTILIFIVWITYKYQVHTEKEFSLAVEQKVWILLREIIRHTKDQPS